MPLIQKEANVFYLIDCLIFYNAFIAFFEILYGQKENPHLYACYKASAFFSANFCAAELVLDVDNCGFDDESRETLCSCNCNLEDVIVKPHITYVV